MNDMTDYFHAGFCSAVSLFSIFTPNVLSQAPRPASISFRQYRFTPLQIGAHQALEEFAVIGHLEVEEFVDDDVFLKSSGFLKKIGTETDPPFA